MKAKRSVADVLNGIHYIRLPAPSRGVETTIAQELQQGLAVHADIQPWSGHGLPSAPRVFYIAVLDQRLESGQGETGFQPPSFDNWVQFAIDANNCCWLLSSHRAFLYAAWAWLQEDLLKLDTAGGLIQVREISFSCEKSTFDLYLTQYARMIRGFDRERYIREYARLGFTHIEVNGLAEPFPYEQGVPGEFYKEFYTYCPALDQFVSSRLNQGLYPREYLKTNLDNLKENVRLAKKYGLNPGLLCFEPRSVPEEFFTNYPTLRGARVDHPFRSFKPRYNLSIVHPLVQDHYAELITHLLKEVPELEFLTIWTNDSGAGFEHTKSLYVGRNGGPYLIREWKDDADISRRAAANIAGFFRLLLKAAHQINPNFRIITRLEPFYGEIAYLWPEIKDQIDVEVNSLLSTGWDSVYPHPCYPQVKVSGSALHNTLWEKEKIKYNELTARGSRSYFYHAFATHTNHEPLLGIPFPWLTYEKVAAARRLGFSHLAHLGGIHPPDKVPYAVNQEVFRLFQLDPQLEIEKAVQKIAARYLGAEAGGKNRNDTGLVQELVSGWRKGEEAVRGFPPLSIYTHYGVVWQRLFVRPLVPDISRIPEKDRAFYENCMCSSLHNPNRVDLAQDVLFELVSPEYAGRARTSIEQNVWPPLQTVLERFRALGDKTREEGNLLAAKVFTDQYFRYLALKFLFTTLCNTAVWIYAVHGFLHETSSQEKSRLRWLLHDMMDREILNCRNMIGLWETAPIEWMIVSGGEETPFIYGDNLPDLLRQKIGLMEQFRDFEPYIDAQYMFRLPNYPKNKL